MKQLKVKILQNKKLTQDFYKMRIESLYLAENIKPGQFVEVRCSDSLDPLLPRPFSVHRILNDGTEILYEVIGRGTEVLARRKKDESLDIVGPLGNGFTVNHPTTQPSNDTTILVAGGIGVAPLVALAQELANLKYKFHVIIGAKTKSHILCEAEFISPRCKLKVATEDGSKGYKGLATDLLKDILRNTNDERRMTIYACGPNAMLKEVAKIARSKRIPCQVSLEEYMACGVGVCLGCPVKIRKDRQYEYKMVCKDGPIFNAEEIIW